MGRTFSEIPPLALPKCLRSDFPPGASLEMGPILEYMPSPQAINSTSHQNGCMGKPNAVRRNRPIIQEHM